MRKPRPCVSISDASSYVIKAIKMECHQAAPFVCVVLGLVETEKPRVWPGSPGERDKAGRNHARVLVIYSRMCMFMADC